MLTSILQSFQDQNVFVLDIPTSIETAQGGGRLYSAQPLNVPYLTPEPKGKKREHLIAKSSDEDLDYHASIQDEIQNAMSSIVASKDPIQWCLPRVQSTECDTLLTNSMIAVQTTQQYIPIVLSPLQNHFSSVRDAQNVLVSNPGKSTQLIFNDKTTMFVPDCCTFLWSNVQTSLSILASVKAMKTATVQFDVILLDPPWPNRSVRNARQYSTIDEQASDAFLDALKVVEELHARKARIAVWITNKVAVRARVLMSMAARGFSLTEEWIWVKVTCRGEFVTPLDGLWRKPYEILLVFQHDITAPTVSRRFVFAVPDVHSRKPNLRILFDTLFGVKRVLELFARNLTAGWWCFGNEVLKFQDCKLWHELPESLKQ